ncbi:MAG TPA: hypothetical protein PKM73_19235 [Verrucomicrobiota bacterium]|nr:hypothetical protein [Verrucomicrobiota bacterium]HNU52128.1 hypothetical protein [Verrucomicrobiota bacterium]
MTSSDENAPADVAVDRTKNQPGVLCGKCDHLNYLGYDDCEKCGSPLYLDCRRCGRRNPRVYTRCQFCHGRLHRRGLFGRRRGHRRHSFWHRAGWQILEVLLVLLGLTVVLGVLYLAYVL